MTLDLRALMLACLVLPACASDDANDDDAADDGSGGAADDDDGGDGVPAANCSDRCADKAAACMAPDDVAAEQCAMLCGNAPTEDELACLETSDCAALAEPDPCGIGGGGGEDESGGGSASAGDDGSGQTAELGESCSCAGGDDTCRSTDGPCTYPLWCLTDVCASECDPDGEACPSGYECTDWLIDGVSFGFYCLDLP